MQAKLNWSVYFQNPDFQEYTRKFFIPGDMKPLVVKYCNISGGSNVLDVGCGTGYFSRLIAEYSAATVTGIDIDENFIRAADRIKSGEQKGNITYKLADACNMPFENQSFDVVTSHTFLHSVPDPVKAIKEMKRVCKPLGTIAAVTPFGFDYFPSIPGRYPAACEWLEPLRKLEEKKQEMYNRIAPMSMYINKLNPAEIPYFFSAAGLNEVSVYPIGRVFSLSNHAISDKEKAEYIRLMYKSETEKLGAFMALPENNEFTAEDYETYKELYKRHTDYLLDNIGENRIWETQGGCFMLVTAKMPLSFGFMGEHHSD